jgi:predicted DNA-binding antitoxin AbrB/MazE fold protein
MEQAIKAIYTKGHFVPCQPCALPEGAEVELILQGPALLPPDVKDGQERARILQEVVEHMLKTPLPVSAVQLTREVLHERR